MRPDYASSNLLPVCSQTVLCCFITHLKGNHEHFYLTGLFPYRFDNRRSLHCEDPKVILPVLFDQQFNTPICCWWRFRNPGRLFKVQWHEMYKQTKKLPQILKWCQVYLKHLHKHSVPVRKFRTVLAQFHRRGSSAWKGGLADQWRSPKQSQQQMPAQPPSIWRSLVSSSALGFLFGGSMRHPISNRTTNITSHH